MRLYTCFTPSHECLFRDWFQPTLPTSIELVAEPLPQECGSGTYQSTGWTKTTYRKVKLIQRSLASEGGDFIIYADCDIQFFRPIPDTDRSEFGPYDIVLQRDDPTGTACTGFFYCRANAATKRLWHLVAEIMESNPQISDQRAFNIAARTLQHNARIGLLPDSFFGGGTLDAYRGYNWSPGDRLSIPGDIILHHANWTRGVCNKVAQLEYVRSVVKAIPSNNGAEYNPEPQRTR